MKKSTVNDRQERIKLGILFGALGLLAYTALPGVLTTFSQVQSLIESQYNVSTEKVVLINSVTIGLTVGASPFSSWLFIKYGFAFVLYIGFAGSVLSLLASAYSTSYYQLFVFNGVLFGVFNNFCYNSLVSIAGSWLKGSKYVGPGTVLVSCGISISLYIFNIIGDNLKKSDESTAVKNRYLILAAWTAITGALYSFFLIYYGEPPEGCLEKKPQTEETIELKEEVTKEKSEVSPEIGLKDILSVPTILWFTGTLLWGLVYVVPFTVGKVYLTTCFNLTGLPSSNETLETKIATEILSNQGIMELAVRVALVFTAAFIPYKKGIYALLFALASLSMGLLNFYISSQVSLFAAWFYIMALNIPVGFMNAMVYTGCENVCGTNMIEYVWPYTNVLLAVGFAAGPQVMMYLSESNAEKYPEAMKILGYCLMLGSAALLACYFIVRKR